MDVNGITGIFEAIRPSSDRAQAPDVAARPSFLIVVRGGTPGDMIELGQGTSCLGRADDNDVKLAEASISRHHAAIAVEGDHAWITDLGSTNGTYLNGRRLPGRESRPLADGDRLQVGLGLLAKFVRPDPFEETFHRGAVRTLGARRPDRAVSPQLLPRSRRPPRGAGLCAGSAWR